MAGRQCRPKIKKTFWSTWVLIPFAFKVLSYLLGAVQKKIKFETPFIPKYLLRKGHNSFDAYNLTTEFSWWD